MIAAKTVADTIYYILRKIGKADKLKIIKLIYLADKYHLIKYGRTITGDDYYAMEMGPVGTTAKDLLTFEEDDVFSPTAKAYIKKLIEQTGKKHIYKARDVNVELDTLSETDKEILDFVIEKFGDMSTGKLIDYVHRYPEWKKYENSFRSGLIRRGKIRVEELLSILDDDSDLKVTPEHIEESKKILTGQFS